MSREIIAQNCICNVKDVATHQILNEVLYETNSLRDYFECYNIPQKNLYEGEESYIRLSGFGMGEKNSIESILEKISSSEYVLKDIAYIKQGIVSGADKYTDAHERKYHLGYTKGEGIFVLHQQEINALELSDEEREFIKEVYKNSQVEKYKINYDGELNVLYVTKESKPDKIPCIINHLQKFKPILESKRETKEGKLPWYSLHWPRDRFLFESDEKIINSRRAKSNIFALDTGDSISLSFSDLQN